jgi:outer membrane protein W
MKKVTIIAALALFPLTSTLTQAGPAFGIGVSYVFGEGVAVGAKIFSDDDEDEAVLSAGIDYQITSGSWRPNLGVGYLGDNYYGDLSVGYDLGKSDWNIGVGAGYANTDEDSDKDPVVDGGGGGGGDDAS